MSLDMLRTKYGIVYGQRNNMGKWEPGKDKADNSLFQPQPRIWTSGVVKRRKFEHGQLFLHKGIRTNSIWYGLIALA